MMGKRRKGGKNKVDGEVISLLKWSRNKDGKSRETVGVVVVFWEGQGKAGKVQIISSYLQIAEYGREEIHPERFPPALDLGRFPGRGEALLLSLPSFA